MAPGQMARSHYLLLRTKEERIAKHTLIDESFSKLDTRQEFKDSNI